MKTKQLQYNIEILMTDASPFCFKNDCAKSFHSEMTKSYLGVKLNHPLLMRRGLLYTCDWTVSKFIENVILNRIMLINKQEPIEYHMCFH